MAAAYRKASSYADMGTAHLLAEADGRKIEDESTKFLVAFVRPNKIHLQAYAAELVCDGKKLYAYARNVPDQVLVRPAPPRLTMKNVLPDRVVAVEMNRGFAGGLPQLALLLGDDPLDALLRDFEEPQLSESGEIQGRQCYRVKLKGRDGTATFWIDQETFALRRIVLPTEGLREAIGQERPIDSLSVVADFTNARLDGTVDPKAFEFEVPKGAEVVQFLVPPDVAQLLGKPVPNFKFVDLHGKPVTPASLAGKVAVLDFWATWCGPCRESLPKLQKVHERYKNNPKVAFYAVSVDDPRMENGAIAKTFEELKVNLPIVRETERSLDLFKRQGAVPTTFIVNAKGIVQDCERGANPRLAEVLPEKLDEVLAGRNIYEGPQKEFLEQVERLATVCGVGGRAARRPAARPQNGRQAREAAPDQAGPAEPARPAEACAAVEMPRPEVARQYPCAKRKKRPSAAACRR